MNDKETIIKNFILNFVVKEKRERSHLELTEPKRRGAFIDRFNHDWDTVVNTKCVDKIGKDFDYPAKIQALLGLKDNDFCYVISHYDEVDDQILPFKEVFNNIYGRGLATIIMNVSATKFYLETEQEQGTPDRFIGQRTKN